LVETVDCEPRAVPSVSIFFPFGEVVNISFSLYNELQLSTIEIRNISTKWMLSAKLQPSELPISQVPPEKSLCWSSILL
jgi:hypothetical protein